MKRYSLLLVLGLSLFVLGAEDGQLTIKVNGQDETVNVVSEDWCRGMISVNGRTVTLNGGGRAYISNQNTDSFNPNMYKLFNLEGKRLCYNTNLNDVGCSCNAALYGVNMPGHSWGGNPDPTSGGDYYCDANFNAELCPELDIFEANKFTMASTPHSCSPSQNGHFSDCDHGGCGTNIHNVNPGYMCPGGCTIDTNQEFQHCITFHTNTGYKQMTNTLNQNGKSVSFDTCGRQDYLGWMSYFMDKWVLTLSLWGSDYNSMSWLDGMTGCSGDCNAGASKVYFSNIEISDA